MSRKMKDSGVEWIGEIPEEWELRRAKALLTPVSIKNKDPNVVLLAATQDRGVIPKNEVGYRTVVIADENVFNLKVIRQGQFCITLRSFQGGIEYCSVSGGISSGYTVLELNQSQEKNYFKYLLKSQGFIQELNKYKVSIRDGQNLPFSKVGETLLPVVPLSEQQAIADYLGTKVEEIDTNISKLKSASVLLSELKQSLIYEAVTGKTFEGKVIDRKMKDSGVEWIGEIPEEWRASRIKDHFYQFRGSGLAKKDIDEKGAIPCILYGELFTKYGNAITKIVSATNNAIEGFQAEVGDLILPATTTTSGADLARASLLMTPAKVGGDTHILRSKSTNICVPLLPYIFSASRDYFANADKSVTVAHSSKGQIGSMSFVLGSFSEQQAIADYLDCKVGEIDNKISIIERKIELLAELKQSVIYEAVTGKIDVRAMQ